MNVYGKGSLDVRTPKSVIMRVNMNPRWREKFSRLNGSAIAVHKQLRGRIRPNVYENLQVIIL